MYFNHIYNGKLKKNRPSLGKIKLFKGFQTKANVFKHTRPEMNLSRKLKKVVTKQSTVKTKRPWLSSGSEGHKYTNLL